ncbi:hypothetical protein LWI28_023994 [Acer negundo]|uniref:Uncharacterized protein n=1 Tax=Acer negundo TaxID=4023 RepID=A0AAD5INS9_ACENE|nr:hypothetical protein LWI28_023994 [Acer negundo]
MITLVEQVKGSGDKLKDLAKQRNENVEQVQAIEYNTAIEGVIDYSEVSALKQVARGAHSFQEDEKDLSPYVPNSNFGDARLVIEDIKALFEEVGVVICQAVPRNGNSLAHNLAFLAFTSSKETCWLNTSPSCIVSRF